MNNSLNKKILFISLFIFYVSFAFAQPYLYFPKYSDKEQDERDIDIYRLDLQTGVSEMAVSNVGRVVQLFSNSDQSNLFIQGRGYLNVLELRNNYSQKLIIDGISWIYDISDIPQTNRIYVSIGSDEEYEKTIVLNRSTYDTLRILDEFMSFHKPFLSADALKFFRFIPDSVGIFFDIYDISSGSRIIENKKCGNVGPFVYDADFSDGKMGVAIIVYDTFSDPDFAGQKYSICMPESGNIISSFPFPFRSEAKLSPDAKKVIVEEVQFVNDNDPNTPAEYRPGNIYIFSAQTGALLQKFNFPPEGKILLFDNYPDKLFYLTGTEENFQSIQVSLNVVTPISTLIDSLTALLTTCLDQKNIGDKNFVKELTSHLDNAKKHLNRKDSLKCAQEIEKFQSTVNREYKEANTKDHRYVTVEGWKFLYYNAEYILERLITLPAKSQGMLEQQIEELKIELANQQKSKNIGGMLLVKSLSALCNQAEKALHKHDSTKAGSYLSLFQFVITEIHTLTKELQKKYRKFDVLYVNDEAYIQLYYRAKYILEALPAQGVSVDITNVQLDDELRKEMNTLQKMVKE